VKIEDKQAGGEQSGWLCDPNSRVRIYRDGNNLWPWLNFRLCQDWIGLYLIWS